MKERPITFNADMVRAILAGRKTQTRRVVKPQPYEIRDKHYSDVVFKYGKLKEYSRIGGLWNEGRTWNCPYGVPGDQLWIKEKWTAERNGGYMYRADDNGETDAGVYAWKSSIFMPRSASRITLEITSVRVERVQEITPRDALSEGIDMKGICTSGNAAYEAITQGAAVDMFRMLWDSINAKRDFGWDANPWVWVIEFRRIEDGS